MESASGGGDVLIEEALLDVLRETDLLCYQKKLYVGLQLTRIEHFDHATDEDLIQLGGLAPPSVRRLREAIDRKKKLLAKKKPFFNSDRAAPGSNMVPVPKKEAGWLDVPESTSVQLPGSTSTSLIKPEEIKLMERLGEGTFATVKRAIWTAGNRKVDVAVKILKDVSADVMEDLLLEVSNMQKLQHPNLIKLYGIVLSKPTMMVTELCDGGALLDRLRSPNKPLIMMTTLVDFAQQIAKGMTYLESMHCVHRDLATRNVLLTDNDKTIKICDFGLMRCLDDTERLYVMSAPKKVPFSWCPPESLRYRQFSHASDVWAFGVTLWELFSYGEEPWVGYRAADVLKMTESGERLCKPERASKELDDIMRMCWEIKPERRPKFGVLAQLLKGISFDISECTTVHHAVKDGDLALNPRDKVIVINTPNNSQLWFGQNVTSKLYGQFNKNTVTLRSVPQGAAQDERISKPLTGSFVHTGHGDVRGGLSWGHPDKIDDIYLNNPVLKPVNDGTAKRSVPTVIHTINDVSNSVSCPPKPAPAPKPKELSPQRHQNGRIKRNTISDFPVLQQHSASPPPLPSIPPAQHRPLPNVHSAGTLHTGPATVARVQGPSLSDLAKQKEVLSTIDASLKEQLANRRKMTEIPRPTNSTRLCNVMQPKQTSVTPPPIRATDFTPAPLESSANRQKLVSELKNTVQQRPRVGTPDTRPMSAVLPSGPDPFEVSSEIRILAERDRYNDLFRSQTLAASGTSAMPGPSHAHSTSQLNQTATVTPNNGQVHATVAHNHGQTTAASWMSSITPTVTHNHSTAVFQNNGSSSISTIRPPTVTPASSVTQNNAQTYSATLPRPSAVSSLPYASNRVALPAAAPPVSQLPSYSQAVNMTGLPPPSPLLLGSTVTQRSTQAATTQQPAVARPNQTTYSWSSSSSSTSSYASYPTTARPPEIGFIHQPQAPQVPVDGEVLALFDPLANGVSQAAQAASATPTASSNEVHITPAAIEEVYRLAGSASKTKCGQMLKKFNGDKQRAVQELKIDQLLEMGLVAERNRAVAVLRQSNWDLNTAAASLLPP